MANENEINKMFINLNIIWIVLLVFLIFYLFLGLYLENNFQASIKESFLTLIRTILYIITCVDFIISIYIRKYILSKKYQNKQSGLSLQQMILKKYLFATIISLAISETIGINGLVLFLLGKNRFDLYVLIIISLIAVYFFRPKKNEFTNLIKEYQNNLNVK